jgi:hypothetical protein
VAGASFGLKNRVEAAAAPCRGEDIQFDALIKRCPGDVVQIVAKSFATGGERRMLASLAEIGCGNIRFEFK